MSLQLEMKGRTRILRLNRPERGNSLDPPTLVQLRQAFLDAQTDDKVKILQLTAVGEKDFCTGIDVSVAGRLSAQNRVNIANIAGDIAQLIFTGKPTIVGLNGRTMGMGVVFATAADYRIAVDEVTFRMPEVDGGIFPSAQCIALMTRTCGLAWTRKMLMTGRPFSPKDALQAGIVDEVVPRSEFGTKLQEITSELNRKQATLLNSIKYATNRGLDLSYMDVIGLECELNRYYEWQDAKKEFERLDRMFPMHFKLLGDPEQLLQEYHTLVGNALEQK